MTVIVDVAVTEAQKLRLTEAARGAEIVFCENDAVDPAVLRRADIIFGVPGGDMLAGAENLKFLQIHSAGVGGYIRLKDTHPGARLCCASGCYGPAISEHMLGALLSMMKKFNLYRDNQNAAEWKKLGHVDGLDGAKVLVLGMGDIGSTFARKVSALGAEVTGIRRLGGEAPEYVKAVYPVSELDRLLPEADVVAMSMPETPETVGMMNEKRFSEMKPGAYLINVGRGSAVDGKALLGALRSGRLGGAALDVTSPEPLPADDPLWREPKCVITPHVSGGFSLPSTLERIVDLAAYNIRAFMNGEELKSEVDFGTGYRARH